MKAWKNLFPVLLLSFALLLLTLKLTYADSNMTRSANAPGATEDAAALSDLDVDQRPAATRNTASMQNSPPFVNAPSLSQDNVRVVGQLGGTTSSVAVVGDYAYAGVGPRMLIFDVSDPADPAVIGQTKVLPGFVSAVSIDGDYAYVGASASSAPVNNSVHVFDVSNPVTPVKIGQYNPPGFGQVSGIAVSAAYAFITVTGVSFADGSLRVVDVSNPAIPVEVGFLPLALPHDVAVAGDYAYVASGGLRVIDVSDPSAPIEVGAAGVSASGVDIAGNYVYVAANTLGLRVVDVSDPTAPVEVSVVDSGEYVNSIAVKGDHAYATGYTSAGSGFLAIVNVSNPAEPIQSGRLITPGYARDVTVAGPYAYVAEGIILIGGLTPEQGDFDGLRIVDVSDPTAPIAVGSYHDLGNPNSVAVAGDNAYVMDSMKDDLRVVEVVDPTDPVVIGAYDGPGDARSIAVFGNFAYVTTLEGSLRILDVTDPAAPTEVGFYDPPSGYARNVAVSGDYAYVAVSQGSSPLRVLDISNPAAPVEIGSCDTAGSGQDVDVAGAFAYVADEAGLRVIDVSDPANPVEVGTIDTPGTAQAVAIDESYAYIADSATGLHVVDVSNPNVPIEVGSYDTPGLARDVAITGTLAYVADGAQGLRVINVSSPVSPVEVGSYDTPGEAWAVAVMGTLAYVADGKYGGLQIFEYVAEPPASVAVAGPESGLIENSYPFTATVSPITATIPMTYSWQASGLPPVIHSAGVTDTVSFTWAGSGTKVITVTVDNGIGIASATHSFAVYTPAVAVFSASPTTGTPPLDVLFTNLSTGDFDTCLWDFGDGGTSSKCNNPTYAYTITGTYSVSLTVSGLGGNDTISYPGYITIEDHQIYLPIVLRP